MHTLTRKIRIALAAILLVVFTSRPARAQDPIYLPADFLFERFYEWKLERDQTRLQNDLSRGDVVSANRDLNRSRIDQWHVLNMRRSIRRDLFLPGGPRPQWPGRIPLGATLVPHPQYPGYGYYPSNPSQLYLLPQPPTSPNPAPSGTGASDSAAGSSARAAASPTPVPIEIVNAQQSGAAVDYVVDGVAYQLEGGQHQRLNVSPSSTIVYNRGGNFGSQRYKLSAGIYEFESSETGLAFFKLPTASAEVQGQPMPTPIPRNVLPNTNRTPSGDASGASLPGRHG